MAIERSKLMMKFREAQQLTTDEFKRSLNNHQKYDHSNWDLVSAMLPPSTTITPLVYGRYLQLVLDKSAWVMGVERRKKIPFAVSVMSPSNLIKQGNGIVLGMAGDLKWRKKMKKMPNPNKNLSDLKFGHFYSIHQAKGDNELIYLGRCIQFLLDTDEKRHNLETLVRMDSYTIMEEAHKTKNELLLRQSKIPTKHNFLFAPLRSLDETEPCGRLEKD